MGAHRCLCRRRGAADRPPAFSIGSAARCGTLHVETTAIADIYQVDVPLAGLAASEYSVQFMVAVGGREASESVIFRVTP